MKKRLSLKFDYLYFCHYNSTMSFDSQDTLFSTHSADTPLAQRARPQDLSQIIGWMTLQQCSLSVQGANDAIHYEQ